MGTRRLTAPRRIHPSVAAAIGLIIAVAGSTRYVLARDLRAAEMRAAATATAGTLASDIIGRFHDAVLSSVTSADPRPLLDVRIADGRLEAGPAATAEIAARVGDPVLADAVSTARDLGSTQLAVFASSDGGSGSVFVVVPRFAVGGSNATTLDRRNTFLGARVTSIDPAGIIDAAEPSSDVSVRVLIDGVDLAQVGIAGSTEIAAVSSRLLGKTISIHASTTIRVPFGVGLAPLVAGILFAGASFELLRRAARRVGLAEAERDDATDERALIVDVGRLLQASLELSDTMPGVALRLSDEFDLRGITLLEAVPGKEPRPIFTYGNSDRGGSVVLPLGKAGRDLGALVVSRERPLSEDQLRALETICGLISAALANSYVLDAERSIVEELNRVNDMKTDFLATVSHEVRTPLASIIGFAALLRGSWDRYSTEQIRDFVARIDLNAVTLSAMLTDILDFSRLERGAVDVVPSATDVGEAIADVVRRNGPIFAERIVEIDAQGRLEAWADRAALEQVVSNLLTNAVKFSPEGSRIKLRASRHEDRIRVSVEDEGPGVMPAEREQIFERFYRGSSDLARTTRGAGIGLSVVADLVNRMGGTIHVEQSPAGGAAFVIGLRAVPEPARTDVDDVRSMT